MRSLQHVLWRGAMALSLLLVGVGSAIGLQQPAAQAAGNATPACDQTGDPRVRSACRCCAARPVGPQPGVANAIT